MTILSGFLAWLMLSGAIALHQRNRMNSEEHFERVLFAVSAGGIAAAILFFGLITIQLVLAIVEGAAAAAMGPG